jgi:uncharacterized protein
MMRAVVLALALSAAPALAQTPAGAPPADPAALAAARELVASLHLDQTMKQSMGPSIVAMRSGAAMEQQFAGNPQFEAARTRQPAAWADAMRQLGTIQADITEKVITDMQPEITAYSAEVYARNFSAAELHKLSAFYKTSIGQKVLQRLPAVMSDTLAFVQAQVPKRIVPQIQAAQPQMTQILSPLLAQPGQK